MSEERLFLGEIVSDVVPVHDVVVDEVEEIDAMIGRAPTTRQRMVLKFIYDQTKAYGYAPTLREIGAFMGITSTNGVNDHLRALERKGLIMRESMLSRAMVITRAGLAVIGAPKRDGDRSGTEAALEEKLEASRETVRRQRVILMRAAGLLREIAPKSPLLDAIRKELGEGVE